MRICIIASLKMLLRQCKSMQWNGCLHVAVRRERG